MASENEANVKFTADTAEAKSGIEEVTHKLKDLSSPVRELMEAFGQLRKTLVEAFVIEEAAEFIEHIAELGEQAVRTSQMLGMSVEEVSKLGFAAKMVGGNTEAMTASLVRVERSMAEARDGTGKAAEAYAALGISQEQLKNSTPAEMLNLVANAFEKSADGADKNAIANDIGGRSMVQLIPLLNKGAEGIKDLGDAGVQTGSVLTTMQAEGLEKTAQGLTILKSSVEGAGIQLFEVFKPSIDAAVSGLASLVQVVTGVVEAVRVLITIIEDGLLMAFAATIEECEKLGVLCVQVFENIKLKIQEVISVLDELVHGHLQAAVDAQNAGEAAIAKSNKKAADEIAGLGKQYDELKAKIQNATIAALLLGGNGKEEEKEKLHAPTAGGGVGKEDHTDEQNAKNDLATEVALGKLRIQNEKDVDTAKVASGQMTKLQELNDLKDFTAQEYLLNMEAANKEMALYDEDSAQYHALINKKRVLTQQYNNEVAKLSMQTTQLQQAQYTKFFSSLNQGFNQMITGVLQGTQTLQQAMGRFFSDILAKFVQDMVVTPVLEWAESKAKMLLLNEAFGAENAGVEAASAAEAQAAKTAANMATITADGALTFAGVMANLSPILGPAAAGPAAASEALVMAQAPQASLAVGAFDLDSDMVAQLHAGEMVVPKTFADGLRDNGGFGGGGGSVSITIQAIDSKSGAQFLMDNSHVIAKEMSKQARNFNKNVPAWKGK